MAGRLECVGIHGERVSSKVFKPSQALSLSALWVPTTFCCLVCLCGLDLALGAPLEFALAFEVVVGVEEDVELGLFSSR